MMRRFFLFIFAFFIIGHIFPQSISISSFKSLDTDLTANTVGTMEKDQNGETAALIKVVTTQTGFTFDGGSMGVVKTKQTPGEIWVYIPRGSKKISIKHPQLGVLRDYYYPIPIEAARTYEMVLISGEVQTTVKQTRASQYIIFQLKPNNAIVELNGELLETYDGIATKMMRFGTYNYRVQAPNYLPETGQVTIDDPENKKFVSVSLKPNFAQVSIKVDNNAEIWINGEKKGNGSWSGSLGAGIYEFEAKKEGYRNTLVTHEFVAKSDPQIVTLEAPIPIYGEADINSQPAMADIYIDEKKVGQTPQTISKLLIGNHQLCIRKTGYIDKNTNIIIKENEITNYVAKLEKSSSELPNIIPSGQSVFNTKMTGIKTHDGGFYSGDVRNGIPHGYGRAEYSNGNIFEGYYVDGKRQGYGTYSFYDGEKYEGEWYQDQQHGEGTYYFSNNNKYVGMWFKDYQHGHGIMYYYNGDKYDGEWRQDKRSGKGTYTFASGAYYKGEWLNNKKHGHGIYKWGDGKIYEGEWINDEQIGKGKFTYPDGTTIDAPSDLQLPHNL